jgi:hypothetical protein
MVNIKYYTLLKRYQPPTKLTEKSLRLEDIDHFFIYTTLYL